MPANKLYDRLAKIVHFSLNHPDKWQEWVEENYSHVAPSDALKDSFLKDAENFIDNFNEAAWERDQRPGQ